jgi:hypothetical protein
MTEHIERYLERFEQSLQSLPQAERMEALQAIRGHCQEALSAGEVPTLILARLGQPEALAQEYGAAVPTHTQVFTNASAPMHPAQSYPAQSYPAQSYPARSYPIMQPAQLPMTTPSMPPAQVTAPAFTHTIHQSSSYSSSQNFPQGFQQPFPQPAPAAFQQPVVGIHTEAFTQPQQSQQPQFQPGFAQPQFQPGFARPQVQPPSITTALLYGVDWHFIFGHPNNPLTLTMFAIAGWWLQSGFSGRRVFFGSFSENQPESLFTAVLAIILWESGKRLFFRPKTQPQPAPYLPVEPVSPFAMILLSALAVVSLIALIFSSFVVVMGIGVGMSRAGDTTAAVFLFGGIAWLSKNITWRSFQTLLALQRRHRPTVQPQPTP